MKEDTMRRKDESLGQLVRDNLIYTRFGKQYKKLKRHQVIEKGAMQSWCDGELKPITNADGKTIGATPMAFSDERDFYNPVVPEVERSINPKDSKSIWTMMAISLVLIIISAATAFNIAYTSKTKAIYEVTNARLDEIQEINEIQAVLITSYKQIIQKQIYQINDYEELNQMNNSLQKIQVKIIRDHGLEQELIDQM